MKDWRVDAEPSYKKSPGTARAFLIWTFVHFSPANLWFAWSVLRAGALTERL